MTPSGNTQANVAPAPGVKVAPNDNTTNNAAMANNANTPDNGAAPPPNAPATTMPAPANEAAPNAAMATNTKGPSGSLQKYNDEWRTSKLVGATVYNNNGDSIGTVDDLLTDDSGKITQAVISTGSVLGMGGKLVAVPFDQLKFEPSAGNNGAPPVVRTPPAGSASTTTAANQAPSNPRYYSIVLPNATKDLALQTADFQIREHRLIARGASADAEAPSLFAFTCVASGAPA